MNLNCSCCRIKNSFLYNFKAKHVNSEFDCCVIVSDFSMPGRFSLRNSPEDIPPPLPEKKRNSAGLYESDALSGRSSFTTSLTIPSNSSPTNSISSELSISSEEPLDEPPPKPSRLPSSASVHRRDSRSSQYDNIDTPECCSPNLFEFNRTSFQMGMACKVTNSSLPPPLPVKKGSTSASFVAVRHDSQYDNVTFEQTSRSPPAVVGPAVYNMGNVSLSLTADNNIPVLQPDVVPRMPSRNVSPHVFTSTKITEVHKKTFSVTRLQDSLVQSLQVNYAAEVSNVEGSQQPPPIPPKKHGQSWSLA